MPRKIILSLGAAIFCFACGLNASAQTGTACPSMSRIAARSSAAQATTLHTISKTASASAIASEHVVEATTGRYLAGAKTKRATPSQWCRPFVVSE